MYLYLYLRVFVLVTSLLIKRNIILLYPIVNLTNETAIYVVFVSLRMPQISLIQTDSHYLPRVIYPLMLYALTLSVSDVTK